jgi:aspartyl-tRNA(Asn)/glutamyl-tRNA(Gln) amidotransferase subunit B
MPTYDLEPIIGLEIHIQLKTKSKMFCRCANIFGDVPPNTAICPICLGYPGTLPVPNQTAIKWIQKAGAALNCELATTSKFDRKSYFYPDLPKGYQISQFDQPFCGPGHLDIVVNGKPRTIGLTRIHLEEDAAKNTHPQNSNYSLVDYNRAGTPLIEIVTEPDIRSAAEAKVFLQELQRLIRSLNISDADMEKGQLRCDANISLREKGTKILHPKTEIKNVNSFRFVEKALEYEIKRQTKLWEEKQPPAFSSTRGFNSTTGKTIEQRTKEEAADYRYFPEPDIPPFTFTQDELGEIRADIGELPNARQHRLIQEFGITDQTAQIFVKEPELAGFFEAVASELKQLDNEQVDITSDEIPALNKLAANLLVRHLRHGIQKTTPQNFAELVVLIHQNKINKNAASQVIIEMRRTGGDPDHIIENLGLKQTSSSSDLESHVDAVIEANPDVVTKIKSGKGGAIQFLMGQVMARSQGKANPTEVIKLINQKLGV